MTYSVGRAVIQHSRKRQEALCVSEEEVVLTRAIVKILDITRNIAMEQGRSNWREIEKSEGSARPIMTVRLRMTRLTGRK